MSADVGDRLVFEPGGFGPGYSVELRHDGLWYSPSDQWQEADTEELLTPSPAQWTAFWSAMIVIGVWQWATRYEDARVLDGTQWLLELRHGQQQLTTHGSNAYPLPPPRSFDPTPPFDRFLLALAHLTGKPLAP